MEGAVELAEEVFHMPVRIGVPMEIEGLTDMVKDPRYATGVGLILFGKQNQEHESFDSSESKGFSAILARMKKWFQGNF